MKKRIISSLMALALCLSLLPTMALATEDHTHDMGTPETADDITFTAWTINNSLPDIAGNYYLDTDVTLTPNETDKCGWEVPAGESKENPAVTNLCLNGHVIKLDDGKTGSVIKIPQYATLNLYDCDTTTEHAGYVDATGLWHLGAKGSDLTAGEYEKTIYGGVITGGNATDGGGVSNAGTFTMSDGTITGNTATKGGGVYAAFDKDLKTGVNILVGGTITGNTATGDGGGVYVDVEQCFAAGTPITMADGSQKPIETLKIGDVVRVFDHDTGTISTAKLFEVSKYPEKHSGAVTLHFSHGIDLTVVYGHSFFDKTANKYVAVTRDNVDFYVGHDFYNVDNGRWETLIGYDFLDGEVDTYIITSEKHLNCVANGMLSNEDGFYTMLTNIFEYGDGLKINAEKKADDLKRYGLFGYEELKYVSREVYDILNLQYLNVALGKGMITKEALQSLEAYWAAVDPELLCDTAVQQGVDEAGETYFLATATSVQNNSCYDTPGVYLGGTIKIIDNFKNTNEEKTENNLYLNDKPVTLGTGDGVDETDPGYGVDVPADGMLVGVTTATAPADDPVAFTGSGATDNQIGYFFSDNPVYSVTHSGSGDTGRLQLIKNWPELQKALNGTTAETVPGVFRVNKTSPLDIALLTDITAGTGDTTLTIGTGKTVTLRLDGHTIDRNLTEPTENGSAIKIESDATLNVLGTGTITGGKTIGNGGGINNSGTLTLIGVTVDGNKAANGGGIYNEGTVTLNSAYSYKCILSNNTATADGGGIYSNGNTADLGNSVLDSNTATGNGGAVYTKTYTKTNGAILKGCKAANGGAVYVAEGGRFQMVNGLIGGTAAADANTATGNGGGVYVEHGGTATFGNSASVTDNKAANGGGIYSKGAIGLETATISNNTATGNGGGIYLSGGDDGTDKGSIFLGKDAKVENNTNNNLYLCDDILLAKFGTGEDVPAPITGMSIGVTTQTAPTSGNPVKLTEDNTSTETYKTYLVADDSTKYEIVVTDNHLELKVKPTPSGGDYTPTVTVPVTGDKDSVKVTATVSGSNATVKNVTSEQLETVGTGENVTIDLSNLSKSVSGVTIPKTTFENVAASEADGLEVKLPNGTTAVFDSATVAAVAEQAAGSSIQLVVDKENKAEQALTAAQKETVKALNDALVLDAYFVSNGKRISDFKGGEAELTVSYPTTKPVRVWYVAEDGTKELVPSTFDGKAAKFVVTHFSHYAIEVLDGSSYAACPQDNTCVYAKFTDANTAAWYHDGVHYCVENGMMNGVSDTKFAPSGTLSRAMIVTMLWRMEGEPVVNYAMSFKDVKADQWYTEAIRWAQSTGVVDGYSADSFGPDDDVTREQLAVILYNYAKHKGIDTAKFTENTNTLSHTDVFTISEWANAGMHFCIAAGVIVGDNGMLYPQNTATRAEAACMVQRFCENVLSK